MYLHAPVKDVPRGWSFGIIGFLVDAKHFITLSDQFLREQVKQLVPKIPGRELCIHGQACIGGMGNLVDVVTDAAELSEKAGVHGAVSRPVFQLDFPVQDQPLAQTRKRKADSFGVTAARVVVVVGQPDADQTVSCC